jgi:hypothetical protein
VEGAPPRCDASSSKHGTLFSTEPRAALCVRMKSLFLLYFSFTPLQIRPSYTSSEKGRKVEIKMRQPSAEEKRRKKKC